MFALLWRSALFRWPCAHVGFSLYLLQCAAKVPSAFAALARIDTADLAADAQPGLGQHIGRRAGLLESPANCTRQEAGEPRA